MESGNPPEQMAGVVVFSKGPAAVRTAFDLAVNKGVPDSLLHHLWRCGALKLGWGNGLSGRINLFFVEVL